MRWHGQFVFSGDKLIFFYACVLLLLSLILRDIEKEFFKSRLIKKANEMNINSYLFITITLLYYQKLNSIPWFNFTCKKLNNKNTFSLTQLICISLLYQLKRITFCYNFTYLTPNGFYFTMNFKKIHFFKWIYINFKFLCKKVMKYLPSWINAINAGQVLFAAPEHFTGYGILLSKVSFSISIFDREII